MYLNPSRKLFGPSTDMHLVHFGKNCSRYPWNKVLAYELAFFARYQTVGNNDAAWAMLDPQLVLKYLNSPDSVNPSAAKPASTGHEIVCNKFASGAYCDSRSCRYRHICTFDRSRCFGSHPAHNCPFNPNCIPSSNRGGRKGNSYKNPYIRDSNPNYTSVRKDRRERND